MDLINIDQINLTQDRHRIDLVIRAGHNQYPVYFQTQDAYLEPSLEAFLALVILPAMKLGAGIAIPEGFVSKRFLEGMESIQQVFRSWKPKYSPVDLKKISARPMTRDQSGEEGVFFSAGLDSYYSFLTHLEDISSFVYLDGFDIPLREQSMRMRAIANCREIGRYFKKRAIIVETNARDFIEKYVSWSYSHGSVMGAVGLLLMPQFERFYIAGAGNPADREPFGSHPDLDPNWGTEILEFIHEAEVDKIDKCRLISNYDFALNTIHVCLRYPESGLNCGECEKCLRSQVYLESVGAAERSTAFPGKLDLKSLGRLKVSQDPQLNLLYKALSMLEAQGDHSDTINVLKKILYRPTWKNKLLLDLRKIRKKAAKRLK